MHTPIFQVEIIGYEKHYNLKDGKSFIVYKFKCMYPKVAPWFISKRYSELQEISSQKEIQHASKHFPPKSLFDLSEAQIEKRKQGLQIWINAVLDHFKSQDDLLSCKILVHIFSMEKHIPELFTTECLLSNSMLSLSVTLAPSEISPRKESSKKEESLTPRGKNLVTSTPAKRRKSNFAIPLTMQSTSNDAAEFDKLLEDDTCRTEFRLFCEQERSVENIGCFELCLQFVKANETQEQQAIGQMICDDYLKAGAMKEVNLPLQIRIHYISMFHKALETQQELSLPYLDKKLFESLAMDVKMVMLDTFQRYMKLANKLSGSNGQNNSLKEESLMKIEVTN